MAKRTLDPLPLLRGEQATAVIPDAQVRLSASAGTGKTQVLTARVLRLLLTGAKPESILCLTFTKAGAAEMAERIHERLGSWVTMKGAELASDLHSLGEMPTPELRDHARTLFARVLEARGSGLRIQTIHSFCQTLLAAFPTEAGLPPGFRAIEGREEEQVAAKALSDLVEAMVAEGRLGDLDRLRNTARHLSEPATRAFLRRAAAHPDALEALGEGVDAKVRRWLADGVDDIQAYLTALCEDAVMPVWLFEAVRDANQVWGTATGLARVAKISGWLAMAPEARVAGLAEFASAFLTKDGTPVKQGPKTPDFADKVEEAAAWCGHKLELLTALKIAPRISDALLIGRAYARAFADAKRAGGLVDFNDLIRATLRLLQQPDIGPWISYKLDAATDHILVDEAQDTNADQWNIIKAVADEFFAGAGAKAGQTRTIFKVGDFKQAIFGFQGTDPGEFEAATRYFDAQARAAGFDYQKLSLVHSWRSSQPILDATDAVINELGFEAFGLEEPPPPHVSARGGSGRVELLPPVTSASGGDDEDNAEDAEESWLTDAELIWAQQLAERVRGWTSGGLFLRNKGRMAEAGDVMILVRRRGDLARLIVSRLIEAGVNVAGVDRLLLGSPIAVQDLLACIRFVLQPEDDLTLAALLVSPLVGWDQDQLYAAAKGRKTDLWQHLGEAKPDALRQMLGMADMSTPYRFLEAILTGPLGGRRKLITRLGEEARDPIEELLNAALTFEQQTQPTLQLFLDWFDSGTVEIKRDPAKPENAVRVMTVHGAKGLQAPIVVLADATVDPDFNHSRELDWEPEPGLKLPMFRPAKPDRISTLASSAERQDVREAQENWRLLYVAMTRAEEYLFAGGALKTRQVSKGMGERCWHVQIERALKALGAADGVLAHEAPAKAASRHETHAPLREELPQWAKQPAPPESAPPRPLTPSALGVADDEASPPPSEAMRIAAARGVLLHSLFERLPGVPVPERAVAAARWLAQSAGVAEESARNELTQAALAVIEDPRFAAIFGPDALAEVPLAGVVNGRVVAGTADRLLVMPQQVLVVDFKTGRRVPQSSEQTPKHHRAQMAAYVAVLEGIFPGRQVKAALLYTSGPSLVELPPDMLEAFKPGFSDQEQLYAAGG